MSCMFRTLLPQGGSHKGTSSCKALSCGKSTREGKPYCSRHVTNSSYIQWVLGELLRRDYEIGILKEGGIIPPDAHLIRETGFLLRMKPYTAKALGQHFGFPITMAETLIQQMGKRRLAIVNQNKRGAWSICGLTPPSIHIDDI